MSRTLTACAIFAIIASSSYAQDRTDEELQEIFQRQLESVNDASLGKARGLKLVTGNASTSGGSVTAVTNSSASNGDGLTNLGGIASGNTGTVIRHNPKDEVNVQIEFEFDSAALKSSQQPSLDQMCRVMKASTNVQTFLVIGHTDSAGSDDYNKRLSQLRAEEVGRHLIDDCGISPSRLEMVGYGEQFPSNETDTRAPENRRVEFQALG